MPTGLDQSFLPKVPLDDNLKKWVKALAKDLASQAGKAFVYENENELESRDSPGRIMRPAGLVEYHPHLGGFEEHSHSGRFVCADGRIDRHVNPKLGPRPLDRLTTADIEGWRNGLVPRGLDDEGSRRAKDSANRNLATLKAILNHAWRTGLVGTKDAWARVEKFKGMGEARKVFLTADQRGRLLDQCDGAFRDLIEAGFLTGARYGELRALLVSDYDKGRRVLSIRQGKTGPRSVPLSDAATRLFDRLRHGKLPAAPLLARDDGQAWQHSDQDKFMREAARKARLPNGTVYYTLRHTFIANALTGGVDIHTVAKLCGTSVAMIEKHYGKLLHSDARDKLNRIAFA